MKAPLLISGSANYGLLYSESKIMEYFYASNVDNNVVDWELDVPLTVDSINFSLSGPGSAGVSSNLTLELTIPQLAAFSLFAIKIPLSPTGEGKTINGSIPINFTFPEGTKFRIQSWQQLAAVQANLQILCKMMEIPQQSQKPCNTVDWILGRCKNDE